MGRRLGWTCLAALILAPAVLSAQESGSRPARSGRPAKFAAGADHALDSSADFCGNCQEAIAFQGAIQRANSFAKAGQLMDAILVLDVLMFQGSYSGRQLPDDATVRLYVDCHDRLGQLTSLELKLRVNKEKNLRDHAENARRNSDQSRDKSFDGNTPSMTTALAYLAQLKAKPKPGAAAKLALAPMVIDAGPSILVLDKRSKRK